MPQLVWTAGPDGAADYFNHGWTEYTGMKAEDLSDMGWAKALHPDDVGPTRERWSKAYENGVVFETEYRIRRGQDGSFRWFLARGVPLREDGRVVRWIGTSTDIDDQKRARDSLAFVVSAGTLLSAALGEDAICKELARLAVQEFADWCFVTLAGVGGSFQTAAIAHNNESLVTYLQQFRDKYPTRPDSPLAKSIATKTPMLFERITSRQLAEAAQDEEHLRLLRLLELHSAMIVPIAADDIVYGAMTLASARSGHLFDASDLEVASAVAHRAGQAIRNARMFDEAKRLSQRLRFTAKAAQMLLESSDLDSTFHQVAKLVVSEMADACFVARIEGPAVRAVAAAHRDPEMQLLVDAFVGARTMQPEAEAELVKRLKTGEPILRERIDVDRLKQRGWPYLSSGIEALHPTSAILVPLQTRTSTYGAIGAYYTNSGRTYDADDLPALSEIASRASIAIENTETLERERKIASTLQKASLPSLIPQPPGLQFNAVYSPAGDEGEVGGDWYDAVDLDDGSVVISVGDVTGQGLQAAAVMSKVRHALGVVPRHERNPSKILDSADWFLKKRYPDTIVTAFVGIISPDRKTLTYANAGHPYPIVRREKKLIQLAAHGLPLGLRSMGQAGIETFELHEGDLVALYTDGVIEWGRDWSAGEACLEKLLLSEGIAHSLDPACLIEKACTPERSHDDIAVLTVKVGPAPLWSFKADDARAAENARSDFCAYLKQHVADRTLTENAELIFGELIGNVVRHAPGPVEVELDWAGGNPTLHVIDTGAPFTPPDHLPNELSESGRGLFIVRTMSADFEVERIANYGNHVRAVLARHVSAGKPA